MKNSSPGQVKEYGRLKAIYKVSKLLATFDSVEEMFPKILNLTAEVFPLLTVVLIEHWGKPQTTIWHSAGATPQQISDAIINAEKSHIYMSGSSQLYDQGKTNEIPREPSKHGYITLPLILDYLPPLGILQLEGSSQLNENDLEFATAFADIVGVALDRFYKTKQASELQQNRAKENLNSLYHSQDQVENLEIQRDLREAFVSLMSHDLQSPMSVILGSAQLILRRPDDLEVAQKSAHRVVKQVQRVGKMITDLLDANRIRSGEPLPLNKELVDLSNIIKDALSELSMVFGNRFSFENTEGISGLVDPHGMRRIVENLCSNAIKYGSPTSPVTLTLEQNEKEILISVQNEGNVISTEDQKSLFQQFRRSEQSNLGTIKGWGIGLTLVKGVAEAHGGKVLVESDLEKGTVFTVIIPKM